MAYMGVDGVDAEAAYAAAVRFAGSDKFGTELTGVAGLALTAVCGGIGFVESIQADRVK